MRDWCIYNLSLCNGSDDHNERYQRKSCECSQKAWHPVWLHFSKFTASIREPVRTIKPTCNRTLPPPPLPRWNKSHSILSFPFIFRYRHHFFISFNWYSKNYQTHNFFFSTEPGMTKCPHPSDIHYCTFEFLYNEACYEGTEEFKIRCQNFCNGLCRIYGTLS